MIISLSNYFLDMNQKLLKYTYNKKEKSIRPHMNIVC